MKTTAFLFRIAICFLLSLIPLSDVEQWIFSVRMQLRGKREVPSNILILNLEARDFSLLRRRFGSTLPWSPTPTAPAGKRAQEDRLAGLREVFLWDSNVFREVLKHLVVYDPKAVLVAWYIPEEVIESQADTRLMNLAKKPGVIWSSQFDPEGKYMKPAELLLRKKNFGFNNIEPDSDGIIRRGFLRRREHFSLAYTTHLHARPDFAALELIPPAFLINYAGPAGSIPTCRLSNILMGVGSGPCSDSKALSTLLKDKIVILARDADPSSAEPVEFRTPFGPMSRAEVLANEIDTIVNDRQIYRAPFLAQGLIILALTFLGAFYIIYYPVLISALALTGTGIAVVVVLFQLLFHLFDIYIPSANLAASMLITYLVFTGYRLAFQENLQWRSLKQAQYLKELDQMKSNFLSLVSHDLKTPLAKIQAMVERMRREAHLPEKDRGDWKELMDSIENSTSELRHYITSILNLSRIESQKVILNTKSNDINRIVENTLRRLRPLAQGKGIHIEEQLDPLFPVECDEDLIRQVLTNLVDNAIKYSPENSKVIVRSREEDGFIRVEVEDFGPGIPKQHLPLMFRKFSRFLRPIKEQVKGSGLGLYLSKYFIELHGGSIRLKTEEGKGTTMTFTLPLARLPAHSQTLQTPRSLT